MLDVNNLSISFKTRNGESEAVRDVSFTLNKGETLGIVGESGSGKSVTSYSLLGLVPCPPGQITSGTAIFDDGVELFSLSEKQRRKIRGSDISMIFQDPMTSLNPYMRIGDQIIETLRAHTKISKKEAREKAISALEDVGIRDAVQRIDSYPHEFSGGMRQRVMIAMALASESKMLIADEPTTALDVTIQAQILALLADIKRRRELSMIFISHDLAVVKDIADHVLVMKDGEVVERGRPADIFDNPQHEYTQQLISAIPSDKKPTPFTGKDNDISLKVENLHTRFTQKSGYFWAPKVKEINAVDDISLELKKGEILGLVGESGSGKSTFGRSIVRLVEPLSGKVLLNGTDNLLTLSDAAFNKKRRHIQMVFQDPYASLNPRMTVFDTLAEPLKLNALADKSSLLSQVNTLMDDVGLPRNAIRKYPHEFSGGQRQRIAIARALASQPDIIVADEPVSALDVTIQAQILDLLLHINTSRGLSMLFISHDLAVVRYLCDRVAVMQKGKIVELDHCETVFNTPQHDYTKSLLSAVVGM